MWIRTPFGLVGWIETWCDGDAVRQAKVREAGEIVRRGFKCSFLPTHMSARRVGERRPLLVTNAHDGADLRRVAQLLTDAGYIGPSLDK